MKKSKIIGIIAIIIGIISIGVGISLTALKTKKPKENNTMNAQIEQEEYKVGLLKEESIMYMDATSESEEVETLEKDTKVEILSDEAILGEDNNQYLLVKDENDNEGYILYENIELVSDEETEEEIKITKIEIEEKQLDILTGETKKIEYTYTTDKEVPEEEKNNIKVIFKSEDETIATVDEEGIVKAISAGETKIFISNEEETVKEEINIKVTQKEVKVTSVSSNLTNITMGIGEEYTPIYKILPVDATNKEITLTSKNKKIAAIQNDQIQGKALGDTIVTLQTKDENKKVSYNVKVKNAPSAITLNATNIALNIGESFDLDSYVLSGGAMDRKYSSSNEDIVSMNNSIAVAKQAGTATITVETYNGKKATCKVTVTNTVIDSSKNIMPYKYRVMVGNTKQLKTTLEGQINWKSSNSKVATVTKTGLVTAKAFGTTTITATNTKGENQSAIVEVYDHKVSKVTATVKEINIGLGESWTLNEYKIEPTTAINQNISLQTTDKSTVAVSGKNVVGKKIGTATITIITEDGKKKATIKVNVRPTPKSINLNYKEITMKSSDDTYDLDSYITDGTASRLRKYTVKDPSIATIKSSIVIPKKVGSTEVEVETYNGKKATCKVTVTSMNTNGNLLYPANVKKREGESSKFTTTLTKNVKWKHDSIHDTSKVGCSVFSVDNTGTIKLIRDDDIWGKDEKTRLSDNCGFNLKGSVYATDSDGNRQHATVEGVTIYPTSIKASVTKLDKKGVWWEDRSYRIEYTLSPSNANVAPYVTFEPSKNNEYYFNKGNELQYDRKTNKYYIELYYGGDDDEYLEGKFTASIKEKKVTTTVKMGLPYTVIDIKCSDLSVGDNKKCKTYIITKTEGSSSGSLNQIYDAKKMYYNGKPSIKWSSSDTKIATVDSDGNITGKKAGTVTIKAYDSNIKKSSSKKITVHKATSSILLNSTNINLKNGESYDLDYKLDTTGTVTFSSSDTKIATVDKDGIVKAKKAGSAVITAKTYNGKTAKCNVKVTKSSISEDNYLYPTYIKIIPSFVGRGLEGNTYSMNSTIDEIGSYTISGPSVSKDSEFKGYYLKYNTPNSLRLSGRSGISIVTAKSSTSNKTQKGYLEVVKNNINKMYIADYGVLHKEGNIYISGNGYGNQIKIKMAPIYHTDTKFEVSNTNSNVMTAKMQWEYADNVTLALKYKKKGTSTITVKEVYSGLSIKLTVKNIY